MLTQLQNFNVDRMSVDELVALHSFATALKAEYTNLSIDVPGWVETQSKSLKMALSAKVQDVYAKKLADATARMSALKTPQEKKVELKKEIDRLNKLVKA